MKKITTLLALLTFIHLGYTQNRVEGTEYNALSIEEKSDNIILDGLDEIIVKQFCDSLIKLDSEFTNNKNRVFFIIEDSLDSKLISLLDECENTMISNDLSDVFNKDGFSFFKVTSFKYSTSFMHLHLSYNSNGLNAVYYSFKIIL